jgi:6-phosphogluconolactonase (cycloisomerase 2 family)
LVVHPSGTALYVTNQGSANISAYVIDTTLGGLKELTNSPFPGAGSGPTFATTDPNGLFLLVCDQAGKAVTEFVISQTTGELSSTVITASLPSPPVAMVVTK